MHLTRFRAAAAAISALLLFDVALTRPRLPEQPIAAPAPVRDARRVEPSDAVRKNAAPPAVRTPARAVRVSEPTDRAELVRTPARRSAPASGSFAAKYPAHAAAVRSSALGGNSWAVIVGINDYSGSTRDNIGSYQDAVALRQYLLGLGWRSDHVLLIGNRDATRARIVQGLEWLAGKTDARSQVVFHYSGHEKPYSRDVDGDGEARDVALWAADNKLLVDGDLGRLLGDVRGSHVWFNFAVCRAGGFDDPGTVKPGRLITYSSPESELSYEDPDVNHSVFGYYSIVEGMRSKYADANGDGITTVQEAFAYARPRVVERTSNRQHPKLVDEYGASMSLVPPRPASSDAGGSTRPSPAPSPCSLPVRCSAPSADEF